MNCHCSCRRRVAAGGGKGTSTEKGETCGGEQQQLDVLPLSLGREGKPTVKELVHSFPKSLIVPSGVQSKLAAQLLSWKLLNCIYLKDLTDGRNYDGKLLSLVLMHQGLLGRALVYLSL